MNRGCVLLGSLVTGSWAGLLVLLAAYVLSGVILGIDGFRWSDPEASRSPLVRLWRAIRVIVFSASWLPVFCVAWARLALGGGAVRYAKMEHHGAPEGWHPGGGPV